MDAPSRNDDPRRDDPADEAAEPHESHEPHEPHESDRQDPEETASEDADAALGLDEFEADPSDEGLSLEELSRAYAEAIGGGDDPYEDSSAEVEGQEDDEDDPLDDEEAEEAGEPGDGDETDPDDEGLARGQTPDACEVCPRSILEAILFVGHPDNRPLTSRQVAALMRGVRPAEIDDLVQELNEIYEATEAPYWIRSIEAGYLLQLKPEFESVRDVFYGRVKAARLSQAAIDVLAIVAYNQPVTRDEVDKLRNRPSGPLLNQLVRRGLLVIERDEDQPRVRHYRTTERFLQLFQMQSLDELPRSQEAQ